VRDGGFTDSSLNSGGDGTFGSELNKYADSMFLPSRSKIPKSLSDVMLFCRWLFISNPLFRQAIIRMIAHGVTRLRFHGDAGSPEERDTFRRKFKEDMRGMMALRLLGQDYVVYGSAFMRVNFPFHRQLVDRRGGTIRTFSLSAFPEHLVTFDLSRMVYRVPDPARPDLPWTARAKVDLTFRDIKTKSAGSIRMIRLDPRFVKLKYSSWSDQRQVQYSFEPDFRSRISRGELFEINRTPMEILRAVRDRKDFLFKQDQVFCMINPTISGFISNGFGLPEPITAFPNLYRMALYDRLDESISHEQMSPYRFVSPSQLPSDGGIIDGGEFRFMVNRAITEQRMDRTKVSALPIPVNFQEAGGNGKSLVPKDLKDYETKQLMHAMGIPAEFTTGTIQLESYPYAVRLFESSHADLFEELSNAAKWAVASITKFLYGEAYDATLEPSGVVDDANRRIIIRDLYQAQEIPRRVLGEALQLENMPELKKERAEEDLKTQEQLAELQAEAQRRMELGSMDVILQQSAAQNAPVTTPVDTMDQAAQLAQEWLAMPTGQRSQAMQATAAQNRQLYAMAKDVMDQERARGASQGVQQVYAQSQQAPQGP